MMVGWEETVIAGRWPLHPWPGGGQEQQSVLKAHSLGRGQSTRPKPCRGPTFRLTCPTGQEEQGRSVCLQGLMWEQIPPVLPDS